MARRPSRTAALRRFVIKNVREHPGDVAALAIAEFGVSREWVNRILNRLIHEGSIRKTGRTKGVEYSLVESEQTCTFKLTSGSAEDRFWNEFVEPLLSDVSPNVKEICFYGFTEMVNNVIDHSGANGVYLKVMRSADRLRLVVVDQGIGIFVKIKTAMGLDTTKHAVFALSKGKFTTDPSRHTGQGVFFSSRAFDSFAILSSGLFFAHHRDASDWLLESREDDAEPGTCVIMTIDLDSTFTLEEVFQHHSVSPDEGGFDKTRLVLKLAQYADGPLLSRSQAKRVLSGVYRFKEAVIDFAGVDSVGPAFADEIFRVYRSQHPGIEIVPINMNERCSRTVRQAEAAAREQPGQS